MIIILVLLVTSSQSAQVANYPLITQMKSGDHKLLTTLTVGPKNNIPRFQQSFSPIVFGSKPIVAVSMRDLKFQGGIPTPGNSFMIDYKVEILSINIQTTRFFTILNLTSTNTFTLLYYMYIGINNTSIGSTYLQYNSLSTTGQFIDGTFKNISVPLVFNSAVSNFETATVATFIASFNITTSTLYHVSVSGSMINSTTLSLNIASQSNLNRIQIFTFVVDTKTLSKDQIYFFDYGQTISENSKFLSTSFNPPSFNYFNYIVGKTELNISASNQINFYLSGFGISTVTNTAYNRLVDNLIHWRQRQCNGNNTLYVKQLQYCYQTCPTGYGTNTSYCALCSSSCLTCAGDGTTCLSCNPTNKRILNTGKCECFSQFYDSGAAACLACDYKCFSCNNFSKCLSCPTNTNRTLTNNSCPCDIGLFDDLTNSSQCKRCDYTCKSCVNTSVTCTDCDTTLNRIFDSVNKKCLCKSGYKENGVASCLFVNLICSTPCVTCANSSSTCTSCDNTKLRKLSGNQCICQDGFNTIDATTCQQICGDGIVKSNKTQCDDGNIVDGDGCSSTCKIQSNFTCNSSKIPTLCLFNNPYTVNLLSFTRDPTSNKYDAVFQIAPFPPYGTQPILTSLTDYLNINSFATNLGRMFINLQMKKQLPQNPKLSVNFAKISLSSVIPVKAYNNLQVTYYSPSDFKLQNTLTILVIIYIVILWIGSILYLIQDAGIISAVIQLFVFSALAWISVLGQNTITILFYPIRYLYYIFLYNIQLGSKSLLDVMNVGFCYFLLPVLSILSIILLSKKFKGIISVRIKRFVMYDITYAWSVVCLFLVIYGFSFSIISQKQTQLTVTSLTGYSATGLIISLLYIVAFSIISYILFFRKDEDEINPKLELTKKNMFKSIFLPVYYLSSSIFSLIYLCVRSSTHINSLIMIGYLIIVFFIIAFVTIFINKIRYLTNIVCLILLYGSQLLNNSVKTSNWLPITFVALLYINLLLNFVLIWLQRKNYKLDDLEDASDSGRAKVLAKITKMQENGSHHVQNREADIQPNNQQIQQPMYFTVYDPSSVKKRNNIEIIIPPNGGQNYESILRTNARTKKQQQILISNKININQALLASSTPQKRINRELYQVGDINERRVNMDQI